MIMSLVRAMGEAASLDDALVAMERLPAHFSASLLPVVRLTDRVKPLFRALRC